MDSEPPLAAVGGKHVLKIALRLKTLIDTIVPVQFDEKLITRPDSPILTSRVERLVVEAAGGKGAGAVGTSSRKYRAVLVFVLLVVRKWNVVNSLKVLYDSELYECRALAAEYLAKRLIEAQDDDYYLFRDMLCQRYTITLHGRDVRAANALELAADTHATAVIGSSGYQRCMKWIWRGWIVQSDEDPSQYRFYRHLTDSRFSIHLNHERIKTPKYQNYLNLLISFLYLGLYTISINYGTVSDHSLSWNEIWFYVFTFGYLYDDMLKLYDVGFAYIGFWNVFNDTLYILVTISFIFRMSALTYASTPDSKIHYDVTAYYILSCCSPLIWGRILLYLDSVQFFGAMLVVLKELMKESLIFFVLLIIIAGGFLQAFLGLDVADGVRDTSQLLIGVMTRTVLDSPEFDWIDKFPSPYGEILYYTFTFLISTILLNILIALFNSAYDKIYDNATDEYMALVAQKTLRFIRAPDENVFVPPLNLIELILLIIPFQWWLSAEAYQDLNAIVMTIVYSPLLLITAWDEIKIANRVSYNRSRGLPDDANETDEEWDLLDAYRDYDVADSGDGFNHYGAELEQMEREIANSDPEFMIDEDSWTKEIKEASPNVVKGDESGVGWESYQLSKQVEDLSAQVDQLTKLVEKLAQGAGKGQSEEVNEVTES